MLREKIHSGSILLLNFLARGILGDFQVLSDTRCSGISSYSKHIQIGGPSQCESNCNNNENCKAFVYCAAGIPAWCVENCYYFSSSCSTTEQRNGFTLYTKKIHGGWTNWSEWSKCSVTCGDGVHERSRSCTNPAPQFNGNECAGNEIGNKECVEPYCPGIIVQQEFSEQFHTMVKGNITQRIKCAALCSATRSCVSFNLDSDGNCMTKETNDDAGYNVV